MRKGTVASVKFTHRPLFWLRSVSDQEATSWPKKRVTIGVKGLYKENSWEVRVEGTGAMSPPGPSRHAALRSLVVAFGGKADSAPAVISKNWRISKFQDALPARPNAPSRKQ
jgi:hypothetical protein